MMAAPGLSIVMPVLDEGERIAAAIDSLAPLAARGAELIVVDGGSGDGTADRARARGARVLEAPRSRAAQMNAGAAAARGGSLLFLHADTRLPEDADRLVAQALRTHAWGRFDVRIEGRHPMLRVVAAMMNLRSRLTGIATGDQAMFATRTAFEQAGRFPQQPLMEDIELSARLRRIGRPACIGTPVATSGRRWDRDGARRTIVLMWRLRYAYWRGAPPAELHRRYYGPTR
ncbi:MAG: TIGR04283 family arsenosugar biosynthesis glycosyltransferase [bacterium]|jgi:rSAM/selenodomain-associated transferase 2|nr:TIGR04283 family arsenosugar biosynthesis glycosyltransferase [Betaproteobacteria bacterium]